MDTPTRVAVYLRISQDRSGEALGVARQRERCEQLAAARGWTIVGVYEDNDISASSGRHRPGFEALLAARDTYDGILVWAFDRLLRTNKTLMAVLDLHVPIYTVEQGEIDSSTSMGRTMLHLLGSLAVEETEQKRQRLKAQRAQAAAAGAWHGRRCFGYNADASIVPEEAAVIQRAARELLTGASLLGVTRWMNQQTTTVTGKRWTPVLVRQMICAARLSGQREHTKDRARRRVGFGEIVAEGTWEAIISPDQTAELRLLFSDRQRPYAVRRHLLGGLLTCGRCGSRLVHRGDGSKAASRWQCIKTPGTDSCGGLGVAAHRLSQVVDDFMISLIRDHRGLDIDEVLERPRLPSMQTLDKRRGALALAFAEGAIDESDFHVGLQKLSRLREQVAQAQTIHPWGRFAFMALRLNGATPEERWSQGDSDLKRSMISTVVESIVVKPASRKGAPFTPDRVVISTRPRR